MALSMKMFKDKVRFEWSDGEVESVVSLTAEDSEESAIRKLKRVIALVEGEQALLTRPGKTLSPHGTEAVPGEVAQLAQGNGWAAVYGPPPLPERLQGEVELVQPGEDA